MQTPLLQWTTLSERSGEKVLLGFVFAVAAAVASTAMYVSEDKWTHEENDIAPVRKDSIKTCTRKI